MAEKPEFSRIYCCDIMAELDEPGIVKNLGAMIKIEEKDNCIIISPAPPLTDKIADAIFALIEPAIEADLKDVAARVKANRRQE